MRAIHIELMKSMDTSSFIDALRTFFAIRGPAIQLNSNNGTDFVGACNELNALLKGADKKVINTYFSIDWAFNLTGHSIHPMDLT